MMLNLDHIQNLIEEKENIKSKIKNFNESNSIYNNNSQLDDMSLLSGVDFTQIDQEMDIFS